MKDLKEFKPLIGFIKEDKFKLILATIFIFISELVSIFTGYLNGAAVESITGMEIKKAIIYLIIYFLLIVIVDSLIGIMASSMLKKIETRITRKLGYSTYKKALDLPASAYEGMSSGEITNRITNDTGTLSSSFEQLLYLISSLVGSFILIIYVFMNSWVVALEIIIFVFILFLIIKKYDPILKEVNKKKKSGQDKFSSLVTESIRGIREIKTLGVKKQLLCDLKVINKDIYKVTTDEIDLRKKFNSLTQVLRSTLEVLVFITCVILLYYGKISLTFFIAMTYYVYRFMWLIERLNSLTQTYQDVVVSLGRVNELLQNKLYADEQFGTKEISKIKGVIEFKNVSFAYPNEDMILNNFNLTIEPGKKIAIVGKSGQGKSTIFNLITRLFEPVEGEILVDGVNIKEFTEDSLRKEIAIIRQEPFIFNRTIKENFLVLDESLSINKIRKYTKMAYLDDYIMSLPKKYDTVLGEGGVNLSGGQKQRLAIARTLAKQSKIILFDEATSALDNNSQDYIKETIDGLAKDHTVLIVAHRLSTIVDADLIYVIEKGKVAASGTHNELLKNSEIYQKLYTTESLNSEDN